MLKKVLSLLLCTSVFAKKNSPQTLKIDIE
jgi:hypothetical protein